MVGWRGVHQGTRGREKVEHLRPTEPRGDLVHGMLRLDVAVRLRNGTLIEPAEAQLQKEREICVRVVGNC